MSGINPGFKNLNLFHVQVHKLIIKMAAYTNMQGRAFQQSVDAVGGCQRSFKLCQHRNVARAAQTTSTVQAQTLADAEIQNPCRRAALIFGAIQAVSLVLNPSSQANVVVAPVVIKPELAPDQSKYDPTDPDLREAAAMLQRGLNAEDVVAEEAAWTEIIDKYSGMDKPWVPDVVGRAWGNRGNARSRQGKLEQALADYNQSIAICPWSVDPVLNRGVVLEALGRFEEAITDYQAVLAAAPNDPAAWNNLGNAVGGLGRWDEAVQYYSKAYQISPEFSFAAGNRALALYQVGQADQAVREMRNLLRKYAGFTDVRAALTAALWGLGLEGQAETQWQRVDDPRYKDMNWLQNNRRWPPVLISNLKAFLALKSV